MEAGWSWTQAAAEHLCEGLSVHCTSSAARLPQAHTDSAMLQAIDGLDADVLTIENSRSGDEMIAALAKYGYKRDIGPGEQPQCLICRPASCPGALRLQAQCSCMQSSSFQMQCSSVRLRRR